MDQFPGGEAEPGRKLLAGCCSSNRESSADQIVTEAYTTAKIELPASVSL